MAERLHLEPGAPSTSEGSRPVSGSWMRCLPGQTCGACRTSVMRSHIPRPLFASAEGDAEEAARDREQRFRNLCGLLRIRLPG
jgi:hypothetical protein